MITLKYSYRYGFISGTVCMTKSIYVNKNKNNLVNN